MRKLFCFLLSCSFLTSQGQNTVGLPEVINYTKQIYNAGSQNWEIRQGENGLIYFGNNEGLLSFDGTFWKLYPLPNKTIVRSIEIAPDHKIYVGGQNEFGYFYPGKNGNLEYHSLVHLIPEKYRAFDDVWNVCYYQGSLFFRSNGMIFQLNNEKITVYPTKSEWRYITTCNGNLVAEDRENGALFFKDGEWVPVFKNTILPYDVLISSIIPLDEKNSLITTLRDGFFIYDKDLHVSRLATPDISSISALSIYKAIKLRDGNIAIATSMGGSYIISTKGKIVQKLTLSEGLQNNNLRSIFQDRDKNLWLGLENGIDFIAYDNAIKHIYPGVHNMGSGYTAIAFNNYIYLGTSNGLYRFRIDDSKDISFDKNEIEKVLHSDGEVWNLSVVNGQLYMGHHTGAYLIEDNKAVLFDKTIGFWTFQPLSQQSPADTMIAGNYLGLAFYKRVGDRFLNKATFVKFESARFVVIENDHTVWVAHPYKGIFKIHIDDNGHASVKTVLKNDGLPTLNNNYIFKIRNKIVLATQDGMYEYDKTENRFVPSKFLNDKIKARNISYLKEDPNGNIWFVHGKEVSVLDLSNDSSRIINFPELNNRLVNGFENIYPIDKNNILIGSEKGFYHVDFEKYRQGSKKLDIQVREAVVISGSDSLLYAGYGNPEILKLPYRRNSLHFEFSAIFYGQQANIEYSYFLKGFDKGWSAWATRPEKDYTNLGPGTYHLSVKARTNLGNESNISTYTFVINPPWYQSVIAKICYILFVILGGYFLIRYQKNKFLSQQRKYEEKQHQLNYLHQLELDKNEKEIVKLRNEKLEAEVEHKNFELATSAMHLLQKKEMMDKLRDDLNGMLKNIENQETIKKGKNLLKALGEDNKLDESWNHFEMHFDKVHTDFIVRIKQKYPALTAGELKLCAYVRLNISSKEIARLLNISIRGVETTRYRLRKKLGLPKEGNLFEFLLQEQFEQKGEV